MCRRWQTGCDSAKRNSFQSRRNEMKLNHMKFPITDGESTLNVALPPEPTPKTTKPDSFEDGIRIKGIQDPNTKDV